MQEKSKNVVRKVVHRRNEYTCTLKNNRITVRAQRTAAGQNMVLGVYDIENRAWHRGNGCNILPSGVKAEVLDCFGLK